MKRISTATSVANKFGAGKNGFTDGSVAGGVPATDLQGDWFDHVQEELANVIEALGVELDPESRVQLLAALRGRLLKVRVISASSIYVPTPGTKAVRVTVQGAGGGGGAAAGTGANQIGAGSGGNSGAVAQSFLTSGFAGVPMIVGAGGGGGNGGNGGAGGNSSFGTISAPGGVGGVLGSAVTPPFLTPPSVNSAMASGGNIYNLSTGTGQPGLPISSGSAFSGTGASSLFGQGPAGQNVGGGGGTATNPGCGGAGALTGAGSGAQLGGPGAGGVIYVEEFA